MKSQRREFIKTTGLAAAGVLILPACSTGTTVAESVKPIGLQLYTLRNELSKDLTGTLKKVAEVGYQYVELFGYGNRQYFGMTPAEFYKILSDYGLKVRSGHYLTGIVNPDTAGTLSNGWESAIEDAVLGGQQYMACAWLFPKEREKMDHYKNLAELLNQAGEQCKSAGVQFCYHNHDFEFEELEGQIPMEYLMNNTDVDLVKTELDLYWISKVGLDPVAYFEKYPGRTPLWHVKDMAKSEQQEFTEVGKGSIDFKRIFAQAEKSGMQSFFVEQDVSADPLKSIQTSFDYVKGNLV
jgi:sugar phosphate isomerase/epimerase